MQDNLVLQFLLVNRVHHSGDRVCFILEFTEGLLVILDAVEGGEKTKTNAPRVLLHEAQKEGILLDVVDWKSLSQG